MKINKEELEKKREKEEMRKIIELLEKKERKEKEKKIKELKYNEWFKKTMTEKVPESLRGRRNKKERNMIVRFRCSTK